MWDALQFIQPLQLSRSFQRMSLVMGLYCKCTGRENEGKQCLVLMPRFYVAWEDVLIN